MVSHGRGFAFTVCVCVLGGSRKAALDAHLQANY